jgi:hypothetical protein
MQNGLGDKSEEGTTDPAEVRRVQFDSSAASLATSDMRERHENGSNLRH